MRIMRSSYPQFYGKNYTVVLHSKRYPNSDHETIWICLIADHIHNKDMVMFENVRSIKNN